MPERVQKKGLVAIIAVERDCHSKKLMPMLAGNLFTFVGQPELRKRVHFDEAVVRRLEIEGVDWNESITAITVVC